MTASTAYTPLESLLLFQALRSEGVNSHAVFNRISEQLKRVGIVRDDPTYDSGRLSPDALRELYLWLLKEEVKRDLERQLERDDLLQNGTLDPSKRKRKALSPSLPTVHEASQHAHLIPQLVTRLYARYRESAVREIREQERKYHAVKRETDEIEEGKWDEWLQQQRAASSTQSPRPSTAAHTQNAVRSSHPSPASAAEGENGQSNASNKPYKVNKIGDLMNHGPDQPSDLERHRRTSSGTVLPPLSEMAPQSPRFGIPPKAPGPLTTQIPTHSYNYSPTSGHQSPYASHHGHPVGNPLASPQVQQSLSRPSSSPRPILPPPPGMKLPPPSPVQHSASPNTYGPPMQSQPQYPQGPHHRMPNTQSPTNDRAPHGYAPNAPHHIPQLPQQGYYQPQPYQDRRTSYPQHPTQTAYQMQRPRAGGYQLPPFAVDPNQQVPQQYGQNLHQPPVDPQRPSYYAPHPLSAPNTSQRPPPPNRVVSDIIAALATPPRSSMNRNFKRRPTDLHVGTPIPSPVTEVEPLSPVLKRSEPVGRSARSARRRGNAESEKSIEPEAETAPRSTRTRGRARREITPHSVVSSTADESRLTRSHSVSTAAGALPASDDRPGSRGKVKLEPSTPAGFVEIPEAEGTSGGRTTRTRRSTLQSIPQPSAKRNRQRSPEEDGDWSTPPPRSTVVTATRNFHKMSATILNDINSHKHASYFANPVRDKDAPGYSVIVKQPQNLKAIRTAITAGARAVNAASASLDSPSAASASGDATTVELERTADLIPPRAIVNGAQLEKEVLRILANAVMFNPGEDGIVLEAREMWEDVGAKIEAWRGAEREVGDATAGGGNEGAAEAEDEREGRGKRRKVGV